MNSPRERLPPSPSTEHAAKRACPDPGSLLYNMEGIPRHCEGSPVISGGAELLDSSLKQEYDRIETRRMWNGKQLNSKKEGNRISSEMYRIMVEKELPLKDPLLCKEIIQSNLSRGQQMEEEIRKTEPFALNDEVEHFPIELLNSQIFHSILTIEVWNELSQSERDHLQSFLPSSFPALLPSIRGNLESIRRQWSSGKFHPELTPLFKLVQQVEQDSSHLRSEVRQCETIHNLRNYVDN